MEAQKEYIEQMREKLEDIDLFEMTEIALQASNSNKKLKFLFLDL